MSEFRIDQITNQSGSRGPDIAGITTFSATSGMVMPSGPTEYRGGRGRGVFMGGITPTIVNTIDYITISSTGNAFDFGDLYQEQRSGSACASSTHGIYGGGIGPAGSPQRQNSIHYITISSTGNSFDFGDLTLARTPTACSSATRGVFGGGYTSEAPNRTNVIDYITIATLGNASDFGDLTSNKEQNASCSSSTRGLFAGGQTPTVNTIDYISIASTGDAIDFGDLTVERRSLAACSSNIRGIFAGGNTPTPALTLYNVIDFITIASIGNATNFGDLISAVNGPTACSSNIRGIFAGGISPTLSNTIEFITISTTGDATDFGDLTQTRGTAGCSDAHGGLGD